MCRFLRICNVPHRQSGGGGGTKTGSGSAARSVKRGGAAGAGAGADAAAAGDPLQTRPALSGQNALRRRVQTCGATAQTAHPRRHAAVENTQLQT